MKAAKEVYNTPELRQAILELLDGTTLARMLRVEKAVTASVAAVLYKEVPRQLVNKMSRATARRVTYCNAVKILDWSSWKPSVRITALRNSNPVTPIRFDPESFLGQLATWRKKYPQLRTIRYQYPDRNNHNRYVAHLGGEKIVVELESRVEHYALGGLSLEDNPCCFPATPTHPMIDIRHTFVLRTSTFEDRLPEVWKGWLYSNPKMDRRITGIEHFGFMGVAQPVLSVEEALAFLTRRQVHGSLPLTQFEVTGAYNPDQLRELAFALGPGIRSLCFSGSVELDLGELQTAIDILDAAFPNLQSLHIEQEIVASRRFGRFRLSGLAALRQLTLSMAGVPTTELAGLVSELGKEDCIYLFEGASAKGMEFFHNAVKDHRRTSGTVSRYDDRGS